VRVKPLPILVGMGMIALPTIFILASVSRASTVLTFALLFVALSAIGYVILGMSNAALESVDRAWLSLPTGYLMVCALLGIGARLGIDIFTLFWALCGTALDRVATCLAVRHGPVPSLVEDRWQQLLLSTVIALELFP
jgi:hypothetical protein